jgi:tryptophan 7-halogenase
MKIAIVGGGSAGWIAASYLSRYKHLDITIIESPTVPTIGVGESVTIHVPRLLRELGLDEHDMMRETGSVYKFGNNFVGWKGGDEQSLFPFRWNVPMKEIRRVMDASSSNEDAFSRLQKLHSFKIESYLQANPNAPRFTDYWLTLHKQNKINPDFGVSYCAYDYFSKSSITPYVNNQLLFKPIGLQHSFHIDAEKFGDYIRDKFALPNGVTHIKRHIRDVVTSGDNIEKLVFEDGTDHTADLFIDCSGFGRVLINKQNRKWKHYNLSPGDTAIVCQVNYEDPSKEITNHTLSIAQNQGWVFDISLYHRKGTGYIFSSDLCNEDEVMQEYSKKFLKNARMEPRKLKWDKKRLYESAKGNTVAIGMSNGFIEPMEANLFAIIINGVTSLANELRKPVDVNTINWDAFNQKMSNTYDDIHDFILTHYTLSPRPGAFWDEMRSIGRQENHQELIRQKYLDERNSFAGAVRSDSLFPDYMWLHLAVDWGLDITDWPIHNNLNVDDINFVNEYINRMETLTQESCSSFPNNYEFLKETIFHGR